VNTAKNFAALINDGYHEAMHENTSVISFGLGINDPGRVFGTTRGLVETFGEERVFDIPTAENGLTGVAIGAGLAGLPVIMCHQRVDFALLSVDQIVNAAAKWHFMFGGNFSVPITIRMIIGRGWGQGPTHSQSLQSWFAHIPGLKVVMPSIPKYAKDLFKASVKDPNPVIFLEHRWLHNLDSDTINCDDCKFEYGKATNLQRGNDVTIVSFSYQTLLAQQASLFLKNHGISCDIIDIHSIRPLDYEAIFSSVRRTGRLIVVDTSHEQFSIASEVVSSVAQNCMNYLKSAPKIISKPNISEPTSPSLTRGYYPTTADIIRAVWSLCISNNDINIPKEYEEPEKHDVPGQWFTGPF